MDKPFCGVTDDQAQREAIRLDHLLRQGDAQFFKELESGYIYNKNGKQCGLQTMMKYFADRNDAVVLTSRVPPESAGHIRGSFPADSPDANFHGYSIDVTPILSKNQHAKG
jgi:hypothetical protein